MAVTASRPSVTSSATQIATNSASGSAADSSNVSVIVKNVTGSATIYLAGSGSVTTSNGFAWDAADGPISVDLEPGESLYGIVASVTQVCHVLKGGR